MIVKCKKLYQDAKLPERASAGANGYDVYAYHVVSKETKMHLSDLPVDIPPGGSVHIGIGIMMGVPCDCAIRPRSGLAIKHDIELSNSPGTVDPDYRGEVGVLLRNRGEKPYRVEKGTRIAQLIFTHVETPKIVVTEDLPVTQRGIGGFGSTGYFDIALGDGEYLRAQAKLDAHFMRIAVSASILSDCLRGATRGADGRYVLDAHGAYVGACRKFGCIIVKDGNIVAQGYNTRADGCSEEEGCIRERLKIPSGTSLERGCLHAEEVAIQNHAMSGGPSLKGATVYVNGEPCLMCAKLLGGCGISCVVVPDGVYLTNGLQYLRDGGVEVRNIALEA